MSIDEARKRNLDDLDKMAKFEYNWNGYGADPFSDKLIKVAKYIINHISDKYIEYINLAPTGKNTIDIEWRYYKPNDNTNYSIIVFEIYEDEIHYCIVFDNDFKNPIIGYISRSNNYTQINSVLEIFYNVTIEKEKVNI